METTQVTDFTPGESLLAVSLELSNRSWKIALHDGRRDKPAVHAVNGEKIKIKTRSKGHPLCFKGCTKTSARVIWLVRAQALSC